MIRKRVRLREALLPSDGRLIIASSDGLLDRSAENSDAVGLTVEAIGYLPLFRLIDATGHQAVARARRKESSRGAEIGPYLPFRLASSAT